MHKRITDLFIARDTHLLQIYGGVVNGVNKMIHQASYLPTQLSIYVCVWAVLSKGETTFQKVYVSHFCPI